jgi:hypothetical protein
VPCDGASVEHMPAAATPGRGGHACRLARDAHDTLNTRPICGQQPTSARARAFASVQRMVPRRSDDGVACRDAPRQHDGPWGARRPDRASDVAGPRPWGLAARHRWDRAWSRAAWWRARGLRPGRSPGDRPRLPPPGGACPRLPAVGGMAADPVATQAGFAPGGGGWPRPVAAAPRLTGVDTPRPALFADAQVTPALDVPMPRAVIAKPLGPLVPLATGAQANDEAIAHPAPMDPPRPRGLGGIDGIEDLRDECPHSLRDFPTGGLRLCLHEPSPGVCHTGGFSSDEAL